MTPPVTEAAAVHDWDLIDLWDTFPAASFADTPLHLTPDAHRNLAEMLAPEIQTLCP